MIRDHVWRPNPSPAPAERQIQHDLRACHYLSCRRTRDAHERGVSLRGLQ